VTTQLAIPNKRTRFGPKVASRDCWIERIKITKPDTSYWTHFNKYQIAQFKALAELDYVSIQVYSGHSSSILKET
jgi:hypothetical protein